MDEENKKQMEKIFRTGIGIVSGIQSLLDKSGKCCRRRKPDWKYDI